MARKRSATPARSGIPLALGIVLPIAVLAAALAVAAALVAGGAGHRAATKELDARAATVKKAWDVAGRPTHGQPLHQLGTRLNAALVVARGKHAHPPLTTGDQRHYSFATRQGETLRVALSAKASSDALSSGLIGGLIIALGGALLLAVLLAGLVRGAAGAPLRSLAAAIERFRGGSPEQRAPLAGSREVRRVAELFNRVADHTAQLDRQAGMDSLTGLVCGTRLRQAIDLEVKRGAREMSPMALVLLDVDGLKTVNDAHGKQAGDTLLAQMASALKEMLRATDVLGRVVGDEFALIIPKATVEQAEMVIARAREAVTPITLEGYTLTFAAGYAMFPTDSRDGESLMQAAEGALKLAQRQPGSTRRFDASEVSIQHQEGERHEVIAVIEAPDGINPVFQPLVALSTGQISGFEALTRFKQPPKRFPDQWFNLAARVGLGGALEAAAIKKALAVPNRPAGTYLSLNLSPSTLRAPEVEAVLPEDLSGLVVEVTEHELSSDDAMLAADLAALRARGARIAVDDAGAGYAGLQQLMRVQPDLIKLDRSLVQDIHEDPAKQALVDSFVRFGRRTGAQVVAEGIEVEEELRVLADLDVTYGQGYFLAKPGPAWPGVSPWVSEKLLRRSLAVQMSAEDITQLPPGSDQRLAAVAGRIAHATTLEAVEALAPVIREELGADELVLFTRGYDGSLAAMSPRPWLPNAGRLDLTHFPALEGALRSGEPEQILADRGSVATIGVGEVALLANSGFGSLLVVPVGAHAMIQAFTRDQRPWSRAQTNRALVLAYQLAPVLATLAAHAPAA